MTNESPHWFTSSYSDNGGNCVEVATNHAAPHGTVPIRDTKSADGATLTFDTHTFAAFISGIRNGTL